jgi:hypothetical protein
MQPATSNPRSVLISTDALDCAICRQPPSGSDVTVVAPAAEAFDPRETAAEFRLTKCEHASMIDRLFVILGAGASYGGAPCRSRGPDGGLDAFVQEMAAAAF